MNYKKSVNGMSYEFVGADPFNHQQVLNNLASLRARQIAHLRNSPSYLEPIVGEVIKLAYKGFHFVHRLINWSLDYLDGKFAELADI